jgi:hypothetical protein
MVFQYLTIASREGDRPSKRLETSISRYQSMFCMAGCNSSSHEVVPATIAHGRFCDAREIPKNSQVISHWSLCSSARDSVHRSVLHISQILIARDGYLTGTRPRKWFYQQLRYHGPADTNEMLLYVSVFNARPTEPIRAVDVRPPGWKTSNSSRQQPSHFTLLWGSTCSRSVPGYACLLSALILAIGKMLREP